jgi:hypothetical protein
MCATLPTQPNPISEVLASLHLAPRQYHKELTVWPLVRNREPGSETGPRYISLAEALGRDSIVVDEVSEGGDVPHIRVANRGDSAVLVLFGEELVGAKQNRIANASFLVPAASQLVIDVSCVEQGRWSRARGQRFEGLDSTVSHAIRHKIHQSVSAARSAGGRFTADQGEVWEEVGERLRSSGARSATLSYQDYVGTRLEEREEIVQSFEPLPGQVGFVAAIGDEVVGLEVVGDPDVFHRLFQSLLRSYAIDAADRGWVQSRGRKRSAAATFDSPESFLDALTAAGLERSPSLGLGEDLRIDGTGVSGCALEAGGIVHLTVFAH